MFQIEKIDRGISQKTITHNDGKLLHFETQEICYAHVYENLDKLKEFASSHFDGAPVKSIICSRVPFGV